MAPNPYGYVPIPTDADGTPLSVLDEPVFHDGALSGQLLSGELRCTLTALTPLIVGNHQFKAADVVNAVRLGDGTIELPQRWSIPCPVAADKTILEPLRDQHGRVLISGTSIKGMIMQSVGALCAAPMARVEERTLSYRPNLDFPKPGVALRRAPRPAIVESWDPASETLSLRILPSAAMQSVVFVRSDVAKRLPHRTPGTRQGVPLKGAAFGGSRNERLMPDSKGSADITDLVYFRYYGGTDTRGYFAQAHAAVHGGGGRVYGDVLVPEKHLPPRGDPEHVVLKVDQDVLAHHAETIRHLADRRFGHLRSEHPLTGGMNLGQVAQAIEGSRDNVRTPGTLIYVEVDLDATDRPSKVVSFGQNYRYRWRYKDTVRTRWTATGPVERGIVKPHPEERWLLGADTDKHRMPAKLSAMRLLSGYAVDSANPGTTGVGTGDFTQLAGRIAVNMALEQVEGAKPADRFMSSNSSFAIPLKVLGAPRASAEMLRLDQKDRARRGDKGKYVSYGETLDDFSGELGGRVFYRHQPEARRKFDLWRGSHTAARAPDFENIASNQSSIVRFVLKPKRQLRVKIRFRDLRPWELGALITSLRPTLAEDPQAPLAEPTQLDPKHAVKLGHGQPLGLGSVRIDIDRILRLESLLVAPDSPSEEGLAREAVAAFLERTAGLDRSRAAWLDLHRYAGVDIANYPELDGETHGWFSKQRKDNSRARRER